MRDKKVGLGLALLVLVAAGAGAAIAVAAIGGNASGYTLVGPFTNPDQGDATTCAPSHIWASGRFSHTYKVFPRRPDGTYLVANEGDANFVTKAGQSPGACNNGTPDNGNTVGAGVKVQATFTAAWLIHDCTFDPNATCVTVNPSCFIPRFTQSFFGPSAWFESVSETGLYESNCNGSWFGAGPNLSGQQVGDITGEKNADCNG